MERSKLIRIHIDDDKRQVVNVVTWEQRKFSDVVEIGSGMDYKHLGEGDIPVYGTGGYMLSVDSALSEEKDAIGIGRKGTIDKPYILRAPFWTVDTLFYCIPKENHDLDFINCLFQTVDWKKKDESTGVPSLSKVIINNVEAVVPSFDEQKKIGEYFNNLDHLITLHQRKCDEMKKMKKFMLQKMFPKNGQKNPEIRFDGFTDDWEQRKLEDYIIEYHEVTTENNQYPALTSSRKGIFLQTEYFAGNQIASDDNTGYNIVPYGYFTYRHMSDDEIFHFNINDIVENGIVSTLYPVFTTNDKLDSRYLQYQLNYGYEFARFAVLQKQGGSRTYMYLSKLKQLSLTMPKDVEEQKKISGFLMELDNLITLHQRKCNWLKKLKEYMLKNIFQRHK